MTTEVAPQEGVPGRVPDQVLRIEDLAVHFGGIKAVDGITLGLERGLISGILGPNGSGKSTLLGAVTRLTPLTRGSMHFEGGTSPASNPSRWRGSASGAPSRPSVSSTISPCTRTSNSGTT